MPFAMMINKNFDNKMKMIVKKIQTFFIKKFKHE